MTTALGQALAGHREQHPGCQGCGEYLAIARQHTAARQIRAGTVAPHVILSVRERPAT